MVPTAGLKKMDTSWSSVAEALTLPETFLSFKENGPHLLKSPNSVACLALLTVASLSTLGRHCPENKVEGKL